MTLNLNGRGLFVFSDPGGAKPLLAAIKLNCGLKEFIVVSDRVYDFFTDFGIPVCAFTAGSEENVIKEFLPDFIFTGTSYTSTIELRFIKAAKKQKIFTYSFVDHYTNFLGRFQYNNELVYPDKICVTDIKAHSIAISHFHKSSVFITGNFYHEYLKGWKASETREDFFSNNNISIEKKIILFAPDPLTNIGGKKVFGLDETTVWNDLKEAIELIQNLNYTIIIKLHPNQKSDIFNVLIEKYSNKNIIFANQMHTNTLILYADLVIGMFSNILIESQILETPVIRYLCGLIKADPFSDQQVGIVVYSKEMLISSIKKIFQI